MDEQEPKPAPDVAEEFSLDDLTRAAAHQALDRWLDVCASEAERLWTDGCAGYFGRIKMCAYVDDDGVALRIDRSFMEDL